MSEVISFRLSRNNPREARALEILEAWCSNGYSLRFVITEALLKLSDPNPESNQDTQIPELSAVLIHINKLLEKTGNGGYSLSPQQNENTPQSGLADGFLLSTKKAANPGLKID